MPIDTTELMRQVGKIRLVTMRLVDEFLSGEYHSVFKGQGVEFDEVREYVVGDDIRTIDWNVTARTGHPFVKRFSEERELTVVFMVDVSGSQLFGSALKTKSELSAELTCLLALSAVRNQDKIGLILFSDKIEKYIPPRKGKTAALRLVREVLAAEETKHGTCIAEGLRFLNKVQKRKAVVFIISDFLDSGFFKELKITAKHHDLICCHISDPREYELPDSGLLELEDPETGRLLLIDTSSSSLRNEYKKKTEEENKQLFDFFRRQKIDSMSVKTNGNPAEDIRKLFRKRQIRVGRG